jgi:glutaredoxin
LLYRGLFLLLKKGVKMVKIYSRKTCASCKQLKQLFDYKKIAYQVIDLDEHPELQQHAYDLVGRLLLPTVETNKGAVAGYNIPAILNII